MDNNKNRLKDRPKSNAELRKMYFEHSKDGVVTRTVQCPKSLLKALWLLLNK